MVRGRKDIFRRLRETISPDGKTLWIHCASLGEFEQGRPLIEEIKKRNTGYRILLTFFSPSGYELRKNWQGADNVFYLPMDTPGNVKDFLDAVRPAKAIFVKYEFWLNYLRELRKRQIPTYIVSAIFRPDALFFRPWGGIFRKGLRAYNRIFVQNEESAKLLSGIGISNVQVSGDTRFDRVTAISDNMKEIPEIEKFRNGQKLFIAGSTWPEDEKLVTQLMEFHPEIKFLIVPHEIDVDRITTMAESAMRGAVTYTGFQDHSDSANAQLMIMNTVGLLSSAYRYGDYAFIGGGFGMGIHNTLEAATFGLPMAFGPNYEKFREARELIELGSACVIADYDQLEDWFRNLQNDPALYAAAKAKAISYVAYNKGATSRILDTILEE